MLAQYLKFSFPQNQNRKTMQLLQDAIVSNNADISIRESSTNENEIIEVNDDPSYFHHMPEDAVPAPIDFGS